MAKDRILIPPDTAAVVLFGSDHTCCVCRDRGRSVQIHHIDENPSNNDVQNLSVLCLLCHDDTQIKGGFGRKLDSKLVIQYRNDWIQRVINSRDKADELAAIRMAGSPVVVPSTEPKAKGWKAPCDEVLIAYVMSLPTILDKGNENSQVSWNTGKTAGMVQGTYDLIDIITQMLVHLASWFPENHFGQKSAAEYFSLLISTRYIWHRSLAEPDGKGTGGTIIGPITVGAVLADLEKAVDEMVAALLWDHKNFSLKAWRDEWNRPR